MEVHQPQAYQQVLYKLREKLGFDRKSVRISEPYQMLGDIDNEMKVYLQTDIAYILPQKNMFGIKNSDWKEWRVFDGTPVVTPGGLNTIPDKGGDVFIYPQGDKSALASARMPAGGFFSMLL